MKQFLFLLYFLPAAVICPQQASDTTAVRYVLHSSFFELYHERAADQSVDILQKNISFKVDYTKGQNTFNFLLERNDFRLSWLNKKSTFGSDVSTAGYNLRMGGQSSWGMFQLKGVASVYSHEGTLTPGCEISTQILFSNELLHSIKGEYSLSNSPYSASVRFENDGISFGNSGYVESSCFSVMGSPSRNMHLTISCSRTLPAGRNAANEFSYQDKYYLQQYASQLEYRLKGTVYKHTMEYNAVDGSELDMLNAGLTFGYLAGGPGHLFQTTLSQEVSGPAFVHTTTIGYAEGGIKMSGEVESWPFTSVIQSMVVNRMYGKASVSFHSFNVQVNRQQRLAKWCDLSAHVLWYGITPTIEYKTWQPLFLVFGVKNVNQAHSDIRFIHLFRIGVEPVFHLGVVDLSVALNQYVPILVKQSMPEQAATPAPSPTTPKAQKKVQHGGTYIAIQISRAL